MPRSCLLPLSPFFTLFLALACTDQLPSSVPTSVSCVHGTHYPDAPFIKKCPGNISLL